MSKEFYGGISISGRIGFFVKAKDEDEARDIVLEDIEGLDIVLKDGSKLEVTEVEWELLEEPRRGNVSQPFIRDFEIIEQK